jgi:hypothetical protein
MVHFGAISLLFFNLVVTALITSFMIRFVESLLNVFDIPDQMSSPVFASYKLVSNRTFLA